MPDPSIEEVQKRLDDFLAVRESRDLKALMDRFGDDSVILPNHEEVVRGKAEIEKWYKGWWERDAKKEMKLSMEACHVETHGDLRVVCGKGVMEIREHKHNIKWVMLIKLSGDSGKIHLITWNISDPHPAMAELFK